MSRWKNKLRTGGLLALSVVLILAAVIMGAVRLVDLSAPRYRQDLANLMTEAIDQPVEVGRMGMSWRSMRPTIDLGDVVVLDPDNGLAVFELREIHVPFRWMPLLRGRFEPVEVVLEGMAVTLEWRADGSLGVQGIEMLGGGGKDAGGELDVADVVEQLRVLGRVVVKDSKLAWQEFGEPIGLDHVTDLNAELELAVDFYSLSLEAELPEHLGEQLALLVEVSGDVQHLDDLQTNIDIHAEGLHVQGWIQPLIRSGLELRGGTAEVDIESVWQGLQPKAAHLVLNAEAQQSWQQDELQARLPGLSADVSLAGDQDGWAATINALQYQDANGDGPVTQGSLGYQPLAGGFGTELRGQLDVVRISDLLAWTTVLSLVEDLQLPDEASGELADVAFEYRILPGTQPQQKFQARLQQMAVPPSGPLPGLTGLNGELDFDGETARIKLDSQGGQLQVRQVFEAPVPLDSLKTVLTAKAVSGGWQLVTESLSLKVATLTAAGSLELLVYGDERSPEIDLKLDFSATEILPVKPLIPIPPVLPAEVGRWLHKGIRGGRVPKGEMVLRGALADFPYVGPQAKRGEFRIEFDVERAEIEYAEEWPRVSKVYGHAVFIGQSMRIEAHKGEILQVPVNTVRARIVDFARPSLLITGRVEAGLDKQLSFLANSPLREDYQGLLDVLDVQGPGALDLDLRLPLSELNNSKVSGDIHVQGATLRFAGLPHPVTDVQGVLRFTEAGLRGTGIKGRFLDLPATAQLTPEKSGTGAATRLQAIIPVQMPQDRPRLETLLGPVPMLAGLRGSSDVEVSGLFDSNGASNALLLSSDLRGMAVTLGAPLEKEATDQRKLQIEILPANNELDIGWEYSRILRGRVRLINEADRWQAERGVLRLGATGIGATLPLKAGWSVTGDLPVLDLENFPLGGDGALPTVHSLDVHLGLLRVAGQEIRGIGIRMDAARKTLHLTGADSEGELAWREQGERILLNGQFKRLSLNVPKKITSSATDQPDMPKPAINPARLPGLILRCQQLVLGDEALGALEMRVDPIKNGLRLTMLDLKSKRLELRGGGEWTRIDGLSSGSLVVNLNSDNIKDLLKASGFAPNISARVADVFADVHWKPHADGLVMPALNGKLRFEIKDGSLLDVDPGAGRVLSLLSFYSLPRRLTLDFTDVTGKGTAFDKLDGSFIITDGDAFTKNLEVTSPSLEIDVRGRVGLAARDYDQTVTIQPELSSSVALAGALAGGPVVGIGLWLAQELLDEPFEQAAKLVYHLGGSWDDPVIEPVKAESKRKAKAKSAGRPGKRKELEAEPEQPPSSGPRK